MKIHLIDETHSQEKTLLDLVQRWYLEQDLESNFSLVITSKHLELRKKDEPNLSGIFVDFVKGSLAYRRCFGGGRCEAIAKAVGIKGNYLPYVLDATAGFGRDAFLLSTLGCHVSMLERNPIVAALLYDALQRGYRDTEIGTWLYNRLTLLHVDSQQAMTIMPKLDVIYLDPMYPTNPTKSKKAMIKKEMRILQLLVGKDEDADELLALARHLAKKRVVVKRPCYARPLGDIAPHATITTKKCRFDIYQPSE
ncbi:class I SAM-dependent methyltransferase [Candidatus Pantoea carbekii]|uniref:Ribosomal RNA small subunit methyltransferase J n=1 Tax=Candidatus Pantoea carbekii TaxID=1235990 RepID=U3U922_9GAMM|nr:class I SAM-dependent methyltransferase [Candidatus Pantoea carbekii]AKC32450.1 hypothetical protein BMSBPS_0673 [Candidatus Pantoea carbekii]BAO00178.1 putative methyltransferase [Candidatus Pantoea carbekii]